jgi:hypothetical protein
MYTSYPFQTVEIAKAITAALERIAEPHGEGQFRYLDFLHETRNRSPQAGRSPVLLLRM